VPGTTLSGGSVTFSWSAVSGATQYELYAGSSVGAHNYYDSGEAGATTVQASGLPANGSTVYVRLWTDFASGWQSNDYTYTAYTAPAPVPAVLSSPVPGTTLSGGSVTFSWSAVSGATQYELYAGSSVDAYNYYDSGEEGATSVQASGLPANGSTVYVRLWTNFSGTWAYNDYTYTAAAAVPSASVVRAATPPSNGTPHGLRVAASESAVAAAGRSVPGAIVRDTARAVARLATIARWR